jgi:RHS repeat-associated protein
MKSKNWLYLISTSLGAVLLPLVSAAEVAPVELIYQQAEVRSGDGGYSTSVPLDLPAERGGLPVPVSLVHGGKRMGAAGRGWDVPLSFIRENRSFAHRRPTANAAGAPEVPLQVELLLLGVGTKMVPEGTGYVPQRGNASLRAEKSGDTWRVYDGDGRTYTFVRPTNGDGGPLLPDTWLLESIEGMRSNSKVELVYEVTPRTFTGPDRSGVSIDLVRVKYNHSSAGVSKHEIALNYGSVQSEPLSLDMDMVDGTAIMRVRTLTGIEVLSREEVGDTDTDLKTLLHYKLAYLADPDTALPRLQSVSVSGQQGTTKENENLLVARYEYGRATQPSQPMPGHAYPGGPAIKLQYETTPTVIARPSAATEPAITKTETNQIDKTTVALKDVTGDGRADVMFRASDGVYKIVPQRPGTNGIDFTHAPITFNNLVPSLSPELQKIRTVNGEKITDTWRDQLDMNGDGRLDHVVANEIERKWVVYVNKPDPANPSLTAWVRTEHDVSHLIGLLAARSHVITGSWLDGQVHLPLKRASEQVPKAGYTGTAWELLDFNGDSALDFLFSTNRAPYDQANSAIGVVYGRYTVGLVPSTDARYIEHPQLRGGVRQAGWIGGTLKPYGFHDVNGDGLLDFAINGDGNVSFSVAWLGNGVNITNVQFGANRPYSDLIPSFSPTNSEGALVDATGDGIPDIIDSYDGLGGYTVRIGTGTGFRQAAWLWLGQRDVFSLDGAGSSTEELIDVDGDGRLEGVIRHTDNTFAIRHLVGSSGPRALDAGLLTAIENGHGERTEITYASAKDDNTTLHQTPAPEIVVGKVKTVRSGQAVTETTYAYGNPLFGYDPLEQRFEGFGYGRTVAVTQTDSEGRLPGVGEARATITDRVPLVLDTSTNARRLLSVLRGGVVNTVTELAGSLPAAGQMLTRILTSDPSRIGATTYNYDARVSEDTTSDSACLFVDDPYLGTLASSLNTCKSRGFAYTSVTAAWRGTDSSDNNVWTDDEVAAIDDFGRVTQEYLGNDSRVSDDDVCVTTSYATPTAGLPRVLSAVAVSTLGTSSNISCVDSSPLAVQRYVYDGLPAGQVSRGLLTQRTAEQRNALTGELLDTQNISSSTYDTRGRLTSVAMSTEDGRDRLTTMSESDPFDLIFTRTQVAATDAVTQETLVTIDPVTLRPTSVTDANGLVSSTRYDGFGRPVMSLIQPPGESEGAMAYTQYLGFAGGDPDGRRIVEKTFDNPVSPGSVTTATGHEITTSLDEAGRVTTRVVNLGSDYADDLVVSAVVYDELGRVAFAADSFPDSEDAGTAYGTTYFYNTDGTLKCAIRGNGLQAYSEVPDEANERYPTCYRHWFADGAEWVGTKQADALVAGGEQTGVERRARLSAIGQVFERQTWQGETMLEHSTFSYDRLGNISTHRRAKLDTPGEWVESSFVHDSFGQALSISEQETLERTNTYSEWGEVLTTETSGDIPQKQVMEYDGLGRLVRQEEQNDGVIDPATVSTYTYDTGTSIHTGQPATYVLGRLATAESPTSKVHFGYDALGRVIARATRDSQDEIYVETMSHDADGALTELGMRMPDANHALEIVGYTYDSARRLTSAIHSEGKTDTKLYNARSIDTLGRVRRANVGPVTGYAAVYAETGRRLPSSIALAGPDGNDGRLIVFEAYDAVGRELQRQEQLSFDGDSITYTSTYDNLGRLLTTETSSEGTVQGTTQFGYDSLGNILSIDSSNDAKDRYMSYRSGNWDRLCAISSQPIEGAGCNVTHDALGNVVANSSRTLSFYGSGAVKQITQAGVTADFRYDAFGAVEELDITGGTADTRHDRRYGLVEKRDTTLGTKLARNFPVAGMTASRRGHGNDWVFAVGEERGNRFFVDEQGTFVQDATYDGYGQPTLAGPQPTDKSYSREQWNGGDFLATFTLSHLGARLYDPVIGRFLSPDPLMLKLTASTSNPYAFADNDPINFSDPSGMCRECPPTSGGSSTRGDFHQQNQGTGPLQGQGGVLTERNRSRKEIDAENARREAARKWTERDIYAEAQANRSEKNPVDTSAADALLGSSQKTCGGNSSCNPFKGLTSAADKVTQTLADTAGHDVSDMGEWSANQVEKGMANTKVHPALAAEHERGIRQMGKVGKFLGVVGTVGDVADIANASGTLISKPTSENAGKLGETVLNVYLMGKGPYGWLTKWVGIPALKWGWGTSEGAAAISDQRKAEEEVGHNGVLLPGHRWSPAKY